MVAAEEARSEVPKGHFPFFMSSSQAEKYGLKTGPAIVDLVKSKTFKKDDILDDIASYGFMCAFHPCEKHLKECKLDEFVVTCDITSKYGEMFVLLHTKDAVHSFVEEAESEAAAVKAAEKSANEALAAAEAKRLERQNAVYVETPIVAHEYKSDTISDTVEEVRDLTIIPERPLQALTISCPASLRSTLVKFEDCNHDASSCVEFRSKEKIPGEFSLNRIQKDAYQQVAPSKTASHAQTTRRRLVTKTTQYETMRLDDFYDPPKLLMIQSGLISFLQKSLPIVETILQQNENVDIFCDALRVASPAEEHIHSLPGDDTQLKEIRHFTDLSYSKGRALSCIDWHPTRTDMLATSVCKKKSFQDRVVVSGHAESAFVIIWEFTEWIKPALVLRSPQECTTFRFNPTKPDLVVGGCMNGQVIMWDLSTGHPGSRGDDEGSRKQTSPVSPCVRSHLDTSHRRMVADMIWLPPNSQVNSRGQILAQEFLSDKTYQFITLSPDGQVLFWDIRFKDIIRGKLPHIAKAKAFSLPKADAKCNSEKMSTSLMPIFRVRIKRLEGIGALSPCKFSYPAALLTLHDRMATEPQTEFCCASEEGDIMSVNWAPSQQQEEKWGESGVDEIEYVQWIARDHNRNCLSLVRSPFFPDVVASVSDWSFHIWNIRAQPKRPIFASPRAMTGLTGGRWSPTRPGILLLSRMDGSIDVWDFTDSSYSATTTYTTTPSSITSMEFLQRGNLATAHHQLLAVGDNVGSLHIFELPRNMCTPRPNEKKIVLSFFEREMGRLADSAGLQHPDNPVVSTGDSFAQLTSSGSINASLKEVGEELCEEDGEEEEEVEEECAYRDLEEKYMTELGIIPEPEDGAEDAVNNS